MPLLTINLVFPRLAMNLCSQKSPSILRTHPSIVSLIRTKTSAYSNSLSAPCQANSVTTSTTIAKRKGDSTDPWCIPTLTSNSSDNSESTLTLVFAPLYRLIADQAKTSCIPFYLIAHSNTLLGTLSKAFFTSTSTYIAFFH